MEEKTVKPIVYKTIEELFETRDKAIQQKDKKLLETIYLDTSHLYIPRFTKFATEIINVVNEDKDGLRKVAFTKEMSSVKEYGDHDEEYMTLDQRFSLIHLINTALGWRIVKYW